MRRQRLRRVLAGLGLALCVAVCLPAPKEHAGRLARITAYTDWGTTYSGEPTIAGRTAACSWNLPLYSVVTLPDGSQRVCTDRGDLGWSDWVDIFTTSDWTWVPATYGDYAFVEVN